ncbi:MAG: sulfotransferase, partial [Candidatus Promineifilaceae bacterium]
MSFQKVFGIGLNKTGTTTLGQCAEILGYRHMGCDRSLLADIVLNQNLDRAFTIIEQFNFFEDWPWPLIYREIDKQFPNSKFILTVRDNEQAWLASLKRHALIRHPLHHSRRLAYGYDYPH